MNAQFKSAAAALVLLVAAGCASTDGLNTQAKLTEAATLASGQSLAGEKVSSEAWPQGDWWKRFNDSQLDRLMEEALSGSPTLRVAQARARKALSFVQLTGAARYPQVNGSADVTRQRYPEHGLIPPPFAGELETQARLQATLDFDLDIWGKNRAAYAAAIGNARAAEVDAYAARLALSVAVAQAYVELQRAYLQLDVAENALAEREQIYKLTQERFDAGIDSRLAVKQAESALPATRERIAQLNEVIGLVRNQLAALLGQGPDRGLAIARPTATTLTQIELPSNLPAALIGRRPDIVAQRWRVESSGKIIDFTKAQFYPNVSLIAFAGLQSIGLSNFFEAGSRTFGVGPAVTLPIFDAGRLRGQLAGAQANYDEAVERYNEALVNGLRDVVDQLTSFRSLEEQGRQQAHAQSTAQEAYDLALMRFREGVGNYLEVLTAESQLLTQQSLEADLRARRLALTIRLVQALGGGFDETTVQQVSTNDIR
jgi:NodT family efflux transporter outer membrane factor (OMF) lipoprotein